MSDSLSPVIVIDNGSGMCKSGFAHDPEPRALVPSIVGVPKQRNSTVIIGLQRQASYVGNDAQSIRGVLDLTYPIEQGGHTNWNDLEQIWQHTFRNKLGVEPEHHPVLLTEPPLNALANRERVTELMFERFSVPAFYLAMQPVLSMYATTCTTGVVLECGHSVCYAVPVYEGYAMSHAIMKLNLAGRDLTEYLARILMERNYGFRTSAEKEIVREMKEKLCYVAEDYENNLASTSTSTTTYELPDGQTIFLDKECFRCPEPLFQPHLLGKDVDGIHKIVYKSIMKCHLRKELTISTILSGGSSMFPNIGNRLQNELTALASDNMEIKVLEPTNRKYAVWLGGAVLASTANFENMWITREEYSEMGSEIVRRKCF